MPRFRKPFRLRTLSACLLAAVVSGAGFLATQSPSARAVAVQQNGVDTFNVDPVHSTVIFSAMYASVVPFYGQFTEYDGTFAYDGQNPETFKTTFVIPMASIDTHNDTRDGHLKSPDWFNAREYPEVTFASTGLTADGDGTYTLTGDLTLHGVTRPVSVDVSRLTTRQTPRGFRIGLAGTFSINRSDFGVTAMLDEDGIGDEVTLQLGVQGVRVESSRE
ncbi:MAG: YceI family protein [Phycisphaerae bacterium]